MIQGRINVFEIFPAGNKNLSQDTLLLKLSPHILNVLYIMQHLGKVDQLVDK